MSSAVRLFVGSRKGAWTLTSDTARQAWTLEGPQFLGHIVNHVVADPRDGRTVLMAAKTGHLGPTIFRSSDGGRSWACSSAPTGARPGTASPASTIIRCIPGGSPRTRAPRTAPC